MPRKNIDISTGKSGMNRDKHPSTLAEQEYSFALNNITQDGVGEGVIMAQNEPSNLLCVNFPTGFQVIGTQRNNSRDLTYFFLVNSSTGCSEIGYIPNINTIEEADDLLQKCGCDINQILAAPLEDNIDPTPTCEYFKILSDCGCEEIEGNKCLSFNINNPISSELKDERCGSVLYFTDGETPRRRLELDKLDQYFIETIECEECECGTEEIEVCINCEKLLVQQPYTVPCIDYQGLVTGGSLRHGVYSAYFAYVDENGFELTRFMAVTGEIPVKDPNKTIYQQFELDAPTNYAIKLKISNIDIRYKYYKIAFRQRVAIDDADSFYETAPIPVGNKEVIWASNDGKTPTSREVIARDFPIIKTAKTVESANNMLFFSDLTVQSEINLQPVVNFLGQFVKWRTVAAEEDIYDKSEATTKWRSYMRDEVQPYSIRFFTTSGFFTPNAPLIARVKTDEDEYFDAEHQANPLEVIAAVKDSANPTGWKKDVYSILKYGKNDCVEGERIYKWQYYNTASVDRTEIWKDCDINVKYETREVPLSKECSNVGEITVAQATYEFEDLDEGEDYDTLLDYLNSRTEAELSEIYTTYPQLNPETHANGIDCCEAEDLFICEGEDCPCEEPVLTNTFSVLTKTDEADITLTREYTPCEKRKVAARPDFCNPYKTGSDGAYENINPCLKDDLADTGCSANCPDSRAWAYSPYIGTANTSGVSTNKKNWIFDRVESFSGSADSSNPEVLSIGAPIFGGAHISPIFPDSEALIDEDTPVCIDDPAFCAKTEDDTDLLLSLNSQDYPYNVDYVNNIKSKFCRSRSDFNAHGYYEDKIHSNALWWQVDYTEGMVINISKTTKPSTSNSEKDCLQYAQNMRVTVYKGGASNGNIQATYLISKNGGILCGVDNATFSEGDVITIAIDTPIVRISNKATADKKFSCANYNSIYLTPTEGCFSVTVQEPQLNMLSFEGELGMRIEKTCEYTANCQVTVFDEVKCDPIPWEEGTFSYWESTENYPDNNYLYDSSNLVIDSDKIPDKYKAEFKEVFTDNPDNKVFKCKPIRHFKFPDVSVSPITDGVAEVFENSPFKSNKVYPIGIHIDNELIKAMLDIAVDNELITKEFRDSIEGYEIFKGDNRVNRSVIAKGIMYDMQNYEEAGKKTWYSNFPYNDNHENTLIYDSKNRNNFLQHPYGGQENIKFTFHSPETSFNKPTLPFEMKVEGYYLGDSRGKFAEVLDHPKFVILGRLAYRWARGLGIAEATLQLMLKIADNLLQTSQSMTGFPPLGAPVAWAAFGLATAEQIVYFATVDINQKVYEWLKIFDENGTPHNFASFYTSVGYYNSISKSVVEGEKVRGLRDKKYLSSGRYSFRENFEEININNLQRESSVYLSIDEEGEEKVALQHPNRFRGVDNSRTYASAVGYCDADVELNRNLYAPYVSLKEYRPDQFGSIDSVLWLTTSYCGRLNEDNSCDTIFGGDTFLSRFSLKRKYPFFLNAMINESGALANRTPFVYSKQRNIGFPKFYIDNKIKDSENFGRFELPTIGSNFEVDCRTEPKMYVVPPSKFYLSMYGIPSFIVESRYNLNFRYGENNREKDFYPNVDYIDWTQEKFISIKEDNYFFYRDLYSSDNDLYSWRQLPFDFNSEDYSCREQLPNGTIYSLEDSDEGDFQDSWKHFLANNSYNFGSSKGQLLFIKNIENQKVLGIFENGSVIFNSFNTLAGTVESVQIGDGGVFTTRPTDVGNVKTDLGLYGSQHRQFIACEHGYVWVDAKRGNVINLTSQGMSIISDLGMKAWFRENLPFKIKKSFSEIPLNMMDNPAKGLGILLTFDSKYDRLILTKKDFKLKDFGKGKLEIINNNFIEKETNNIIKYTDTKYFEDTSWTISYNFLTKSWVSYHSYIPNGYVSYDTYFQSFLNSDEGSSIYSHNLTNRSFSVFYGKRYNWEITLPIKSTAGQKYLNFVEYKLDAKRFVSEYDYNHSDSNFDQMIINSNRECSGLLNLVTAEKNNLFQHAIYPKYNSTSIDVLAINEDQTWAVNTFFDIVKDNHQQPIFFNKNNGVGKELNNNALNYAPFVHNRFRAQSGEITLKQTKESRIKYILEYLTTESTQYR